MEQAKAKFKSLKDSFRNSLKQQEGSSGDVQKTEKVYKYHHQMAFLLPHMRNKEKTSNFQVKLNLPSSSTSFATEQGDACIPPEEG